MDNAPVSERTIISKGGSIGPGSGQARGKGYLIKIYPAGARDGLMELPVVNSELPEFIIGRGSDCQLVLLDTEVSRQHALIKPHVEGTYMIQDMGSTNGTFVNDLRVERHRLLDAGDLIKIGSSIIKFLSSDHIEAQYHETLYSMMISDGLTGAHNKRFFLEVIEREMVRSQRHRRPLSLAIFDIDHFKEVNDTYGHLVGDAVLRELSRRVKAVVRKDEVFARYGGEEFVVVLPEATLKEARGFAERIRKLVECTPMVADSDTPIPVTISIGIAQTSGERPMTPEDLICEADRKLYEAKRSGRNCVRF